MNEGINLLAPNKKSTSVVVVHRLQAVRIIVVSLLFIVSVSSVILFILVALSPLPALQKQEQSLQETLALSKNTIVKLALVKDRADTISRFLGSRQTLDKTIGIIEEKLPQSATVTTVQADNTGAVVTVESSSLQDLDNFLNGLISLVQEKKDFSQITLVSLMNDSINNQYAVSVRLNPL